MDNGKEIDLEGLLDRLAERIKSDRMTLGEMVEAVEDRGFGPILLVPALLSMLPTGAIPGMPTLLAVLILLVAGQMLYGRSHPWLPRRLRKVGISREKFMTGRQKVQPVVRFIDRFVHPRLTFLSTPVAARLLAALAILMAFTMPPLELVPFAGTLPGLSLLFLALGLSARDGVLILIGVVFGAGGLTLALRTLLG